MSQSPHKSWKGCALCKPNKIRGQGRAYREPRQVVKAATHAHAPHPRRRLTRRVVRGVKWLERFPLPLTVGTMLVDRDMAAMYQMSAASATSTVTSAGRWFWTPKTSSSSSFAARCSHCSASMTWAKTPKPRRNEGNYWEVAWSASDNPVTLAARRAAGQ